MNIIKILPVLLLNVSILFGQSFIDTLPQSTIDSIDAPILKPLNYQETPVILEEDTLYIVKHPFKGISPQGRAEKMTDDLKIIAETFNEKSDSIYLKINVKGSVDIMINAYRLYAITDVEANEEGLSKEEYAREKIKIIEEALINHKYNLSPEEWAINIG